MPTQEEKWGHVRVPPEIWQDMVKTSKQERRTLAAVLILAWELYKAKK